MARKAWNSNAVLLGAALISVAFYQDPPPLLPRCNTPFGPSDCAKYCINGPSCILCCNAFSGLAKQECLRQCQLKWPELVL